MNPIRLIFFGTPEFAAIGLKALVADPRFQICCVITQPDRASGRGNKLQPSAVKQVALDYNLPFYQPEKVKREKKSFITAVSEHGPFDLGIVIAFGQILPIEVLNLPKAGSVNVHASLLPRWRGAAPIQRAILAGDSETGICLMQMEQGLDTGPVYASEKVQITKEDTAGTLHDKLAVLGASLLCSKLPEIAAGKLMPINQSAEGVTIAARITNEEAQINWAIGAQEISRLVRAFNPVPGAFTDFKGRRLKIFGAIAKPTRSGLATLRPGTVYFADTECLEIQCGQDILTLTDVQLEGKRRLTIAEFAKGMSITRGETLGVPS